MVSVLLQLQFNLVSVLFELQFYFSVSSIASVLFPFQVLFQLYFSSISALFQFYFSSISVRSQVCSTLSYSIGNGVQTHGDEVDCCTIMEMVLKLILLCAVKYC